MRFTCVNCGRVFEVAAECLPVKCFCTNRQETPRWAKLLKLRRKKDDRGVGDTAQRIAAKFGGERFKALCARIGIPCGCTERQEEWNRLYPYT